MQCHLSISLRFIDRKWFSASISRKQKKKKFKLNYFELECICLLIICHCHWRFVLFFSQFPFQVRTPIFATHFHAVKFIFIWPLSSCTVYRARTYWFFLLDNIYLFNSPIESKSPNDVWIDSTKTFRYI